MEEQEPWRYVNTNEKPSQHYQPKINSWKKIDTQKFGVAKESSAKISRKLKAYTKNQTNCQKEA